MSTSLLLASKSAWFRIVFPIAVGFPVVATCEAPGAGYPSREIQHDPPIQIGSEGTESIAINRVIFEFPPGTIVGAHFDGLLKVKVDENVWDPDLTDGIDQLRFAASDELRRLGYSVTGSDKELYSEEQSSKPRFLLGANVTKMSYDTYGPTAGDCCTARIDVEWQLFDTSVNQIVLTQPAAGGSRLDGYAAPVVRKAFVSALADLTSSEKFVSLVRKGAAAETPEPSGK